MILTKLQRNEEKDKDGMRCFDGTMIVKGTAEDVTEEMAILILNFCKNMGAVTKKDRKKLCRLLFKTTKMIEKTWRDIQ